MIAPLLVAGLVVLGIAAVVAAAAAISKLSESGKDADDKFSTCRVGSPSATCPLSGKEIPKGCEYLAKPDTVEAPVADFDRIRGAHEISPPTDIKYKFPGDAAPTDAVSRDITVKGRKVKIIEPKGGAPAGKNLPTDEQIATALAAVPGKQLDTINQVVVSPNANPDDAYWAEQYKTPGFSSAATGGNGGVTFYPKSTPWDQAFVDSTAIHEGGHTYSQKLWDDAKVKSDWQDAIKADGRAPSKYAESSPGEDFSESLVMYSLSKGTKCEATAKELYPSRYAKLDELLKE